MPSGYSASALVGAYGYNGGVITPFYQQGRTVYVPLVYGTLAVVVNSTLTGQYTSSTVPPCAKSMGGYLDIYPNSGNTTATGFIAYSASYVGAVTVTAHAISQSGSHVQFSNFPLNNSTFYYSVTSNNAATTLSYGMSSYTF